LKPTILDKGIKLTGENRQQARGNRQQRTVKNSSYDLVKYSFFWLSRHFVENLKTLSPWGVDFPQENQALFRWQVNTVKPL
jgi:hypothetical protein